MTKYNLSTIKMSEPIKRVKRIQHLLYP